MRDQLDSVTYVGTVKKGESQKHLEGKTSNFWMSKGKVKGETPSSLAWFLAAMMLLAKRFIFIQSKWKKFGSMLTFVLKPLNWWGGSKTIRTAQQPTGTRG